MEGHPMTRHQRRATGPSRATPIAARTGTRMIVKKHLAKIKNLAKCSGWKILAWNGFWLIPSGIVLCLMAWQPTPGSYMIGEKYPYGTLMNAWQVSLAFSLIAFGILFMALALAGERFKNRRLWFCLLSSMILILFPHIELGVVLFPDDPTFAHFGPWLISLPFSLLWGLSMAAGFFLAWKQAK